MATRGFRVWFPMLSRLAPWLVGSVFLVVFVWNMLSWSTRGMIIAAYGVAVLLLVLVPALRLRGWISRAAHADGSVVGSKKESGQGTDGSEIYFYPVVQFRTPGGRSVEFTSAIASGIEPARGEAVPVRYRPEDPEQAEVDLDLTIQWIVPGAIGLLAGLGLLVAGVVLYLRE